MIPVSRPSSPIWASTFVLMGMKQPEVIGKHRSGRGCVRVPLRDGVPGGGDSRHSGKAAGRVATFPCCDLLAGARPPPTAILSNTTTESAAGAWRQTQRLRLRRRAGDAPPAGLSDVSGLRLRAQQRLKNVNECKILQRTHSSLLLPLTDECVCLHPFHICPSTL